MYVCVHVFVGLCVKVFLCACVPGPSPCLCGQQFVVVGGALVVVLSVPDDGGQAFAHQGLCNVSEAGGEGGERDMRERRRSD